MSRFAEVVAEFRRDHPKATEVHAALEALLGAEEWAQAIAEQGLDIAEGKAGDNPMRLILWAAARKGDSHRAAQRIVRMRKEAQQARRLANLADALEAMG